MKKSSLGEGIMIGSGELIIILCVVMILFGGKKLPEFARSLGQGIREFKKACNGIDGEEESCKKCSDKSKIEVDSDQSK